ncbi:unnamed protein product [Brachionus calyciflorus]|uniref:Uncharacterized protein n=1 Tax=Brachionus calyciflorus TaxID=104777 RepID=A0A813PFR3_9BILA|nr:unnamed protein product [Brachionus calyciflorus]
MEAYGMTLEDFCSSQRFMSDLDSYSSDSFASEPCSDNNFVYFANGLYKNDEIYFSFKSKNLIRDGLIYSFYRKNLNSVYYQFTVDGCFASITICDLRKSIIRENSIKDHTHPKLVDFEIEISKALGVLKHQVFNSTLSIPQIYEIFVL